MAPSVADLNSLVGGSMLVFRVNPERLILSVCMLRGDDSFGFGARACGSTSSGMHGCVAVLFRHRGVLSFGV